MQSVVKSHLDAIPEDRKAIEKGGGNAVQKLHEVEKYIRKNKLKVCVQHRPDPMPAQHVLQFFCCLEAQGGKSQESLGRCVRSPRFTSKQLDTPDTHVLFMHALADIMWCKAFVW